MNRGLIKNALVTIGITLILLTTYTLGTLTAPSRAEKEQTTVEATIQEKPTAQNPQETATTPQNQAETSADLGAKLDRIASILEDKLSRLGDKLDNLDQKLSASNTILDSINTKQNSIFTKLASLEKYCLNNIEDWFWTYYRLLNR